MKSSHVKRREGDDELKCEKSRKVANLYVDFDKVSNE